ncbi:uncharacterized protein LOC128672222 isoform X1 [Plodia interpunctella]|uniref:uncharacterized protein LOC128672222 isoform X1 n=1 Tax=Plodia interpunctella TaxID=58824 RepID=UPI002368409A|nr:uncharacterized protein LOC128672222 isoform X1 [Plodia interpunctella]
MSVWMVVFLTALLQNSGAYCEDDQKPSIGEQLNIIIKDVSSYLYWLFGYGDDESLAESQLEESDLLTEEFVKDVDDMVQLMHAEIEKRIKHAKDVERQESEIDKNNSDEKIEDSDKKVIKKGSDENSEEKDGMEVIPLEIEAEQRR